MALRLLRKNLRYLILITVIMAAVVTPTATTLMLEVLFECAAFLLGVIVWYSSRTAS